MNTFVIVFGLFTFLAIISVDGFFQSASRFKHNPMSAILSSLEIKNSQSDLIIKNKFWEILYSQAVETMKREPSLAPVLQKAIIDHSSFTDALIYRLATKLRGELLTTQFYVSLFKECLAIDGAELEKWAIEDMVAVEQRDPACRELLQVFLYFKGYKAIQTYRMSHVLWLRGRRDLAMTIQGRNHSYHQLPNHYCQQSLSTLIEPIISYNPINYVIILKRAARRCSE